MTRLEEFEARLARGEALRNAERGEYARLKEEKENAERGNNIELDGDDLEAFEAE